MLRLPQRRNNKKHQTPVPEFLVRVATPLFALRLTNPPERKPLPGDLYIYILPRAPRLVSHKTPPCRGLSVR